MFPLPCRSCLKNMGPFELNFTKRAIIGKSQEQMKTKQRMLTIKSQARLTFNRRGSMNSGRYSATLGETKFFRTGSFCKKIFLIAVPVRKYTVSLINVRKTNHLK